MEKLQKKVSEDTDDYDDDVDGTAMEKRMEKRVQEVRDLLIGLIDPKAIGLAGFYTLKCRASWQAKNGIGDNIQRLARIALPTISAFWEEVKPPLDAKPLPGAVSVARGTNTKAQDSRKKQYERVITYFAMIGLSDLV